MKKIKVISCIITFAIMALIFFFSSQPASVSSGTSMGITEIIAEFTARFLHISNAEDIAYVIHKVVRKAAHFTLFFILGISVANTILHCFGLEHFKLFVFSLIFCLIYAISDEVHQIFVPGRAAMLLDVLIDFGGSFFGSGIFIVIRNLILRRRRNGM